MSLSLSAAIVAKRILAAISAGRVKAAISAGRVLASITASRISASVTAARLQAAIVIGRFIERLNASDNAFLADVLKFLLGKEFQDSIGVREQKSVDLSKLESDSASVSEVAAKSVFKPQSELLIVEQLVAVSTDKVLAESVLSISSDPVFSLDKSLSDSVFATDDFDGDASIEDDQSMAYVKVRSDTASASDLFNRTVVFDRNFSDSSNLIDALSYDLSKALSDAYFVSESHSSSVGKSLSDSGSFVDSPVFGLGKNLTDSAAFSEDQVFGLGKALSDEPLASDVFTRVVSFSRDFSELVGVTDDVNGAAVDDDQTAQYFKNLTNIGSLSDSDVKSVGKNPSDSAIFAESGNLERQNYVDTMTYFSENYVGTSGSLF